MKTLKSVLIVIGIFMISTTVFAQEKKSQKKNETVKYWVSMDCEKCKAKIEKNIAFEKGVKDMLVDLETKTVTITYKTKKTSPEKLEKALKDLDYKVERVIEEKKKNQHKNS